MSGGRSRKSKNFTLPGNPGSAPPPLPMSPAQAERLGELWRIYCFAGTLLLHWRSRVDAVGTLRMVVAVGGPAVSRKDAAEILESTEDDGRLPSAAMLLAATRWYVGLRLPSTPLEPWSRSRVRERQRLSIGA